MAALRIPPNIPPKWRDSESETEAFGNPDNNPDKVTGTGASSFIAGGSGSFIMLTNASNDFRGSVGLIAWRDASITDGTSLKLGASNVSGNLNVMIGTNGVRGTGNLTQNAAVSVQGVTNITAGASNTTINLTNHGNEFVGGVNPTPLNNIANYNVYPAPLLLIQSACESAPDFNFINPICFYWILFYF